MEPVRYSAVARALHWLIAGLIVAAFVLGLTVDDFPKPYVSAVVNVHSLLGLAIIVLTLVRLGWRLTHQPPALPAETSALIRRASHLVHQLLYLVMLLVPMIGIPTLLYRGRGIDFGVFQMPPMFARTPEIFHPLTDVHGYAAYALVALALGHVAAGLYHQFILKDDLLSRMAADRR